MNPGKAIETQKDMLYRRTISLSQDQKDALDLSTEALIRHQEDQAERAFPEMHLLPGETKE